MGHAIGRLVAALCFCVFVSPSQAGARVYRCELDDGHIRYQQIPCHAGSVPLPIRSQRGVGEGLRAGELELLERYRQADAGRGRSVRRAKPPAVDDRDCRKRRTELDALRTRMRRGYTLAESDRLRRERRDHQDYLRRFCS